MQNIKESLESKLMVLYYYPNSGLGQIQNKLFWNLQLEFSQTHSFMYDSILRRRLKMEIHEAH